jgi:hypothetical protein
MAWLPGLRLQRRDVDLAGQHVDPIDAGLLGQQLRRLDIRR